MSKSLFISWISFHGRSDGIANALGMTKVNISTASRFKPLGYVRAFLETRSTIKETRPETVIVMAPPFFAILSVVFLNFPKKYRIFADLHTGVFYDPKWKFALAPTLRLLRSHAAIVTNSHLATICQDAGIETHILHEFIDDKTDETIRAALAMETGYENLISFEYALVPLAYEHDEPLLEILDAATQDPEITWVLTGRAPEEYMKRAPSNVFFPGFVDNETFESLLTNAGCVCALTTKGETMQRAAYEGLSYGKSIVVSSQNVLTDYYGDSVSYTDNSAQGIYESVATALEDRLTYETKTVALRTCKINQQVKAIETIARASKSPAILSDLVNR